MTDMTAFFHQNLDILTDHHYEEVQDEAFRIRYQVYCLEKQFEDADAFGDRKERDPFDNHAAHSVIRNRACGTGLATVRLVMRPRNSFSARFPIEHSYPGLFARNGICERKLPRRSTGEVSRFAISSAITRQIEDPSRALSAGRVENSWKYNCRRSPLLMFGLIRALVELSEQNRLTHWVAVMEPALLRLLARFGVRFTPIGGLVEYHGWRQPCYGRVSQILHDVRNRHPDFWQLLNDGETYLPTQKVASG